MVMTMRCLITATADMVRFYRELFVNRLAYTVQSRYPGDNGRHRFYRPKKRSDQSPIPLALATLRQHLEGNMTIGLYAINPKTQKSKWVAIDADYKEALEDLLKLQWELRQDGVDAALEKSRRGGHLWMFAAEPLPAKDCLIYIANLAKRLSIPFRKGGLVEGIEIFPRQERLAEGEFGNALRGPLGVHQATKERYWFYGADYSLESQMAYLKKLKRFTRSELTRFIDGLSLPEEFRPQPTVILPPPNPARREFCILDYVRPRRRMSGNYWTRCPACAKQGRDKSGDNLAISIADPRKYRCWSGCPKELIRAALGCPIPSTTRRFSA